MALQDVKLLVRFRIPDPHHRSGGLVAAGGRKEPAVGADGHGGVGIGTVFFRNDRLLAVHLPHLDGGIGSVGRTQTSAVGAEGQTGYSGGGGLEGRDLFKGDGVIKGDPLAQADGGELTIRAEHDTVYPPGAEVNRSWLGRRLSVRGRQIPKFDRVVPAG